MTPKLPPQTMDERNAAGFAMVEQAASLGARCPTNDQLPYPGCLPNLARQGAVRIEVYAHNWRVVEILIGEHAGKRTMRAPNNRKPYKVLTADGTGHVTRAERLARAPSAPRPLTREEIER